MRLGVEPDDAGLRAAATLFARQHVFQAELIGDAVTIQMRPEDVALPPRITNLGGDDCVIAVGSPQAVLDKIATLCELSGCDRFILQGDYGGQPWKKVRASLELYADNVLQQVKQLGK